MRHILDRPIWSALASRHAALAAGDTRARRYQPQLVPFAASADDDADSLRSLGGLAAPGETLIMLQADAVAMPFGHVAELTADAVQMVAEGHFPPAPDGRVEPLGEADAEEMLALATLTKPGPFSLRSQCLGSFWGVRRNGTLIAMAGERMKVPGHVELSGLCVHPDAQGQGLGRMLSLFVAGEICAKGDKPFLHAFASNTKAIALYEALGFAIRSPMKVAVTRPS